MHRTPPTILGLDPGTRFLGAVVVRGDELVAFAVHELRNGDHPYGLIGQARRVAFEYIEQHQPQVVAIETPYFTDSKRAATLVTLTEEIHKRSQDLGLLVVAMSPEQARLAVTGNPHSKKIDVAQALLKNGFGELREKLPRRPVRSGIAPRARDRYWFHVFDALALAVAANEKIIPRMERQAGLPTLFAEDPARSTLKPAASQFLPPKPAP